MTWRWAHRGWPDERGSGRSCRCGGSWAGTPERSSPSFASEGRTTIWRKRRRRRRRSGGGGGCGGGGWGWQRQQSRLDSAPPAPVPVPPVAAVVAAAAVQWPALDRPGFSGALPGAAVAVRRRRVPFGGCRVPRRGCREGGQTGRRRRWKERLLLVLLLLCLRADSLKRNNGVRLRENRRSEQQQNLLHRARLKSRKDCQ